MLRAWLWDRNYFKVKAYIVKEIATDNTLPLMLTVWRFSSFEDNVKGIGEKFILQLETEYASHILSVVLCIGVSLPSKQL